MPGGATVSSRVEPTTVDGARTSPASASSAASTTRRARRREQGEAGAEQPEQEREPARRRAGPRARAVDQPAGEVARRERGEQQAAGRRGAVLVGERRHRDLHDADREPKASRTMSSGPHPDRGERPEPAHVVGLAAPALGAGGRREGESAGAAQRRGDQHRHPGPASAVTRRQAPARSSPTPRRRSTRARRRSGAAPAVWSVAPQRAHRGRDLRQRKPPAAAASAINAVEAPSSRPRRARDRTRCTRPPAAARASARAGPSAGPG